MSEKVIGFVCSALVHPDAVGRIYASFYEQGAKDMQMQAVFAEPPVPKVDTPKPAKAALTWQPHKTAKQMVYDAIMAADGKPVYLATLSGLVKKAGFSGSAASVSLHALQQEGKVKRHSAGAYVAMKYAMVDGTPSLNKYSNMILAVIKAKSKGEPVPRSWIAANCDVPRNSMGPQLSQLVKKGYLKRPSPNTYELP